MTRSPTRRRFLQAAGGITLLAVGGAIWRAHDREVFVTPSGAPYDPWTLWNSSEYKNTPVALVAAGILASNPHNTQPWIFRLSDKQIDTKFKEIRDEREAMEDCSAVGIIQSALKACYTTTRRRPRR